MRADCQILKQQQEPYFYPRIFLFLNPCLPEFSYLRNPENVRSHSSNSTKYVTLLESTQLWKCDPIQRHTPISLLLGSTLRANTDTERSVAICT